MGNKSWLCRWSMIALCTVLLIATQLRGAWGEVVGKWDEQSDVTAQQVLLDLQKKSPNNKHPRLMATAEQFKQMQQLLKTDATFKRYFDDVKKTADQILKQPVAYYQVRDGKLFGTSDLVLERIEALALMYRLTGSKAYAGRAWKELENVANDQTFRDWHPVHFLDTAMMSAAVAIGYDWLYDYLTKSQKDMLRSALIRKGIAPALAIYRGSNKDPSLNFWREYPSNWNTVSNAGIGIAALAIADETPETRAISGEVLQYALSSIKISLGNYAPDGGGPEGPQYWLSGTMYMTYFLSSLDAAVGTTYGLAELPGLGDTGFYPIYMTGPAGVFNLGDADAAKKYNPPQLLWMADKYKKPELADFILREAGHPMKLVWYRPVKEMRSYATLPLDKHFATPASEIVTMRSRWNDPNALFAGIHAGDNRAVHGDLDTGTFALDALGVQWAIDPGKDDYNLPGYFDTSARRWDYYRKRAEGHNTLVINPYYVPDQNVNSVSKINPFSTSSQGAFAVTDMTAAYVAFATSVKRGIALIENRGQVLLQDEVQLKANANVWWFMHTRANIKISSDKKSAMLQQGDKRLWARIQSNQNVKFQVFSAAPFQGSPHPQGQNANQGIYRLVIFAKDVSQLQLSVLFVPLDKGKNPPSTLPTIKPLQNWNVSAAPVRK